MEMKTLSKLSHGSTISLATATLLVGSLATMPVHAQDGAHTSISSDGAVGDIATEAAPGSISRAFAGTGKMAMGGGVSMAAPNVQELLALKAVEMRGGAESISGWDSRVRTYTTSYPARAVALVTFSGGRCTGWLIGANTVITAGHCVYNIDTNSWYSRTSYRVYPGYDGTTAPYGYCTAKQIYSVTGWTVNENEQYDIGAIKLNCTVGNTVGWFGFFTQGASLTNYPAIVSGYPGDKPLTQWWSSDTIRYSATNQLFYPNDTVGGMSGSPVWYDRNGPYAMAIHAYGFPHGAWPHTVYNHGTRITAGIYNVMTSWKKLP